MTINRRTILLGSLARRRFAAPANAAPLSAFGLDAAHFGVRPGAAGDQSGALQRAIDQAARTRVPLMLAPGVYRAGGLTLPAGAQLAGVRGATRLILTHGPSLLSAEHADTISLSGLTLDGGGQTLPARPRSGALRRRESRPHHRLRRSPAPAATASRSRAATAR